MIMVTLWVCLGFMAGYAVGQWMIIDDLRQARKELEKVKKRLSAYEIFALKKLKQKAQEKGVEIDADE